MTPIGPPDTHASSDRRAPMPDAELTLPQLERHFAILARAGKHGALELRDVVRHQMRLEARMDDWARAERMRAGDHR